MLEQRNDKVNFNFKVGKGLGNLLFDYTEKEIISMFGKPDRVDIDVYEKDIEETKRFHYEAFRFMISLSMYDGVFEPIKIYPRKLVIDNVDLFSVNPNLIQKFLENIHKERNIEFDFQKRQDDDETIIECPNIGLTIWYQNNILIDVCIEKPIVE